MPASKRRIEPNDILPARDYAAHRKDYRAARMANKPKRTLHVGPYATILFESYDSMWLQVQEMLYIEKGGDEQLADELAAYNPMIPDGTELTATMMLEIEDAGQRARVLATLGRIEDHVAIRIGPDRIAARPVGEEERTNASGKTSAVHFFRFPFSPSQIAAFREPGTPILFEIDHPNYGHIAIVGDAMRAELLKDFA
ncbi:DUF3501 family protein [Rhizorhabdus dicambivorans]|uniref:DUF3501 domain-containing protein n=1 Tax=Rhizorhabdus dicambivorans TaxID=1850238 RepID=A0A2A4FZB8_9SPHN|nr:DUF3501 family protein [Rhizorhabdus dicambivorans]ATE63344.1 DUF3501 domain-containing protein [Rhizorhabdus dicambivorans]PCE43558.1 DUF3501 domain-containing protein [Rhizorhabdus dicambivorans]